MFKVKKRVLLLIAGIIWFAAGINILRIGALAIVTCWGKITLWLDIMLPVFTVMILIGFLFMFYRIVDKHEKRIMGYGKERVSIFLFFDFKGYLLMIFMMGLGIILRQGSFLPDYFFAFFYSGLGFALLVSGLRFIARFFRKNARQIIWTTIGIISVALGTLGIFIPLLPTVPLYLLGSTAFLSGSDLLYEIFKNSKLYKKILLPYIEAGGLTKRAKLGLILFVSFQIGVVTFFLHESILVVFIAGILYLGFLISMIFVVKTIQPIGKRKNREE